MIGPGGQSANTIDGTDYLVYHFYDAVQNGAPCLQVRKIFWIKNGWPTLGQAIIPYAKK